MKTNKPLNLTCLLFLLIIPCLAAILSLSVAHAAKSYEYGNVRMAEHLPDDNPYPVIFRHWSHRDKYTCRLCHVDLEFAQKEGGTGVLEADNQAGRYCGACHDGKEAFSVTKCTSCHPKDAAHEKEMQQAAKSMFFTFKKELPQALYGNRIDWIKAEEENMIIPKDFLPGISFPAKDTLKNERDEPRTPTLAGLPEIIFSHSKHVVWCGCGMCHPDSFAIESGKTPITMRDNISGHFCGRCHQTVAFPLNDCTRCHSRPVSSP